MLKRSHSASVQFNTPSSFLLLFFVFQRLFLFSASIFSAPPCFFSAPPPFVSFLPAFLFFSVHVCPFFQPKNIFFQPKTILSSAQNLFQLSPHHCFSLFLFCFSLFSFCWFCFQRTFSFCSAPPFLLSFSVPHSLFFRHVALYFLAQNTFSAQNVFQPFFSPRYFQFSPSFLLCMPPSQFLANFQGRKYSLQMLHISFI